ncbi:MAG: hypothetical protein R6U58_14055 [Bacteroidales bacterium]
MHELRILGLQVFDRIKEAGRTQTVLSRYAHCIRTRLGFHELTSEVCSRDGFIILELAGESGDHDRLQEELGEIGGVNLQVMSFDLNDNS